MRRLRKQQHEADIGVLLSSGQDQENMYYHTTNVGQHGVSLTLYRRPRSTDASYLDQRMHPIRELVERAKQLGPESTLRPTLSSLAS
jgi:hypothetical protein